MDFEGEVTSNEFSIWCTVVLGTVYSPFIYRNYLEFCWAAFFVFGIGWFFYLAWAIVLFALVIVLSGKKADYMKLTKDEERVIVNKDTEMPFTGKYYAFWEKGTYVCKRCGAALYLSESKFEADCGWPSFDDEVPGAVKRTVDADGIRMEITCANCGAHLGHVFTGEGFTKKNVRHCVNSISIDFIPDKKRVCAK